MSSRCPRSGKCFDELMMTRLIGRLTATFDART
jgi:hypothetical protein